MNQFPFISVAIPAYNEEKRIGNCLKSLSHQTLPKDQYEIIVVVSTKTTDRTAEICKEYGVKVIFEKPGIGLARFRGFEVAKGEILVGTDADTVVTENWLEVILDDFKDNSLVCVTGPVLLKSNSTFSQRLGFLLGRQVYRMAGILKGRAYLYGMNFAVRRSSYEKCGGFDKLIKSAEETDLTNRICKFGKTRYDRNMRVYTSPRRLQEGYLQSFIRYSHNFILLEMGKQPPAFEHYR